jgi:hypothetical protein
VTTWAIISGAATPASGAIPAAPGISATRPEWTEPWAARLCSRPSWYCPDSASGRKLLPELEQICLS